MTLDIPREYEDMLRQVVASGAFASEEEALRHALQLLMDQQQRELPRLPERIDLQQLVGQHAVKPFRSDDPVPANVWPDDESADEFLAYLRDSRQDESPPGFQR